MASKDWRRLRLAFHALGNRAGHPLRGFHQTGGWGRAERERLADLSLPVLASPVVETLRSRAAAPPWHLDGPPAAVREFQRLADRAAALLEPAYPNWLEHVLEVPIADGRILSESDGVRSTLIQDLVQSSIACCRLLEAGVSAAETRPKPEQLPRPAATRRERVDEYLLEATRIQGRRAARQDIWWTAGYTTATEFLRWQRLDPRATETADRNIERVLSDPACLKARGRAR